MERGGHHQNHRPGEEHQVVTARMSDHSLLATNSNNNILHVFLGELLVLFTHMRRRRRRRKRNDVERKKMRKVCCPMIFIRLTCIRMVVGHYPCHHQQNQRMLTVRRHRLMRHLSLHLQDMHWIKRRERRSPL